MIIFFWTLMAFLVVIVGCLESNGIKLKAILEELKKLNNTKGDK